MNHQKINSVKHLTIYRIVSGNSQAFDETSLFSHAGDKTLREVPLLTTDTPSPLRVDDGFMKNRYHFNISSEEVQIYKTHHHIWNLFLESKEEFCLIIEDNVSCKSQFATIYEEVSALKEDWDIFFPFDKTNKRIAKDKCYALGYYWGSCCYFISRRGAHQLKSCCLIRQPLDDEILSLTFKNQLETFCENKEWFSIDFDRSLAHLGRIKEINRTLTSYDMWSPGHRILIQKILKMIVTVSQETNIDLILHGGTLLGAVQHNQIIPWDDDVDLGIDEKDFQIFYEAIKRDKTLRIEAKMEKRTKTEFYKIWVDEGEAIENYTYTFPFVDLWLYNRKDNDILFKNGIVFPHVFNHGFEKVLFEGSYFDVPVNAIECLDKMYKEWKLKFKIYRWNHRLEKSLNKPFQAHINVDAKGRFLSLQPF